MRATVARARQVAGSVRSVSSACSKPATVGSTGRRTTAGAAGRAVSNLSPSAMAAAGRREEGNHGRHGTCGKRKQWSIRFRDGADGSFCPFRHKGIVRPFFLLFRVFRVFRGLTIGLFTLAAVALIAVFEAAVGV